MLHLLCGPRGSGKRDRLLELVQQGLREGVPQRILVPETMSHTWERALLESCGNRAGQSCAVVTFSSLSKRLLLEAGVDAVGAMDGGGRILTMYRAIRMTESALRYYGGVAQKPALISGMLQLCDEFQSCRIEPQALLEAEAGDKVRDMGLIYNQYLELCREQGGTNMDRTARAAELVGASRELENCRVYVYGFSGFTQLEYQMLGALLRKCPHVTVALMLGPDKSLFAEQIRTKGRLERLASARACPMETEMRERKPEPGALSYLARHFLDYGARPMDAAGEDVALFQVRDADAECELAAALCRSMALTGRHRLRDISVICGDLESYQEPLRRAFARYEVPVYLSRQTDLLQQTPVAALLSGLQAVLDGFRTETMLTYLKSGLLPVGRRLMEKLENYVALWDIRGSRWEQPWVWSTEGYEGPGDPGLLEMLEELRGRLMAPLLSLKKNIRRAETGGDMGQALIDFLDQLDYEALLEKRIRHLEHSDRRQAAAEYAQIYQILREALDQMTEVLGEMAVQPAELLYLLRLALSQYQIGTIPVSVDSVNTGDFTRLGAQNTDCLIVLGAVEGLLPPGAAGGSLLTEQERIQLETQGIVLTQSEEYRSLEQESMVYRAVAGCRELILMRPLRLLGGEEARDSYMVRFIQELLPGLPVRSGDELLEQLMLTARQPAMELASCQAGGNPVPGGRSALDYFCREEKQREQFRRLADYGRRGRGPITDPQVLEALYGKTIRLSATRVESVNACRFSYFMEHGLKIRPARPAQLGATQVGSFLHEVVEKSMRRLLENPREDVAAVVQENVDAYGEKLGGLENMSARDRALYESMGQMALEIVKNMLEELAVSDFRPLAFELPIGREGEAPLELSRGPVQVQINGAVDRVDGWIEGDVLHLKVVDYKTGTKDFSLSDVISGINMQMFLYMLALEKSAGDRVLHAAAERLGHRAAALRPAAALYIPAKVAYSEATWDTGEEQRRRAADQKLRRLGVVVEDEAVIHALEHEEADFRFLPVEKKVKGGYTASSKLISAQRMGSLLNRVERTVLDLAESLRDGNIEANPYERGGRSVCDWCSFRAACQFDESSGRDAKRPIHKYGNDEINRILDGKEAEQDGETDAVHGAADRGH